MNSQEIESVCLRDNHTGGLFENIYLGQMQAALFLSK